MQLFGSLRRATRLRMLLLKEENDRLSLNVSVYINTHTHTLYVLAHGRVYLLDEAICSKN